MTGAGLQGCRLDGKVALVTGAGPGNGRAIATALAAAGAAVAVSDKRQAEAEAGRDAVMAAGGVAIATPFDVTDLSAVRRGVEEIEQSVGPVDILVNNAGTLAPRGGRTGGQMGPFLESDPAEWSLWIDLNLYGSLHCIHAVLPGMVERRWGRVVQISSTAAARGRDTGHSTYGAGKAAIEAAIRHIAVEVARNGVTLNALALGSMAGNIDTEMVRRSLAAIPVGRAGKPAEVAVAVRWLASDEAAWVTGQTIHLNGGQYQGR